MQVLTMQALGWDNYQYVLAIYRCQTLAGAARSIGVNETTVSRRLAQTEQFLQLRLFTRRSSGLAATDSGLQLIRRLERVKYEIDEAQTEILNRHSTVGGSLRIACNTMLLNNMLVPCLHRLLDQYPSIDCELVNIGAQEPMKDSDIALRYSDVVRSGTLAYREQAAYLGQIEFGVFASHRWQARGSDQSVPWLVHLADDANRIPETDSIRLRTVSAETMLSCARAGLGKCWLPIGVGARHQDLFLLDSIEARTPREVVRVCQPELLGTARLVACDEWLRFCVDSFNNPDIRMVPDIQETTDPL